MADNERVNDVRTSDVRLDSCDIPAENSASSEATNAADAADAIGTEPVLPGQARLDDIRQSLSISLEDIQQFAGLREGSLFVVGASSSEVMGSRIGTSTSMEVGFLVVDVILDFVRRVGCDVAFQCCEHLNRSLVVERAVQQARQYVEVTAIPVPGAGGAVAAAAYASMADPVLVANVSANAGIDIGDTLIGMHLQAVAVPVRGRLREIGHAHLTMATTRPPLVGGTRAVYDPAAARHRLSLD